MRFCAIDKGVALNHAFLGVGSTYHAPRGSFSLFVPQAGITDHMLGLHQRRAPQLEDLLLWCEHNATGYAAFWYWEILAFVS